MEGQNEQISAYFSSEGYGGAFVQWKSVRDVTVPKNKVIPSSASVHRERPSSHCIIRVRHMKKEEKKNDQLTTRPDEKGILRVIV